MMRCAMAIVVGLAAVATGCGAAADSTDPAEYKPTTISGHRQKEGCARPRSGETLVTRETGGFSVHSTLVVRTDGFAWASAGPAFGGPRCYQLSDESLTELRSTLETADLATLEPQYRGSTVGPEGMLVEIDTATVTADGVTVYAESNAEPPGRVVDLLERLGTIEGAVVREG